MDTTTDLPSFAAWLGPRLWQRGARAALADAVGVSVSAVGRWCSGDDVPAVSRLAAIADHLGLSDEDRAGMMRALAARTDGGGA